jgi:hypothetical protein
VHGECDGPSDAGFIDLRTESTGLNEYSRHMERKTGGTARARMDRSRDVDRYGALVICMTREALPTGSAKVQRDHQEASRRMPDVQ